MPNQIRAPKDGIFTILGANGRFSNALRTLALIKAGLPLVPPELIFDIVGRDAL